jgi:hypothetical protein
MPTTAIPAPHKAEKQRVKLKMAVQGPSGSGKTFGALSLARNLWPTAKICLIDSENESASLYADSFDFDTIPLGPPFETDRYLECIQIAVDGGYDVVILDSITPQWDGEGGILRRKEEMDRRPGSNGYANWASFTPEHERFKQALQQSPIHLIATMRSKQDYILTANDKGKQIPKKVGMAPIQRDQMDYEFTLVFDVEMDHKGSASKDRTGLFNEKIVDLASPKTAKLLRDWIDKGKEAPAPDPPQPTANGASGTVTTSTDTTTSKTIGDPPGPSDIETEREKWLEVFTAAEPEQLMTDVAPRLKDKVAESLIRCADANLLAVIFYLLPNAEVFSGFFCPLQRIAVEMGRKDFVQATAAEARRREYSVNRLEHRYEKSHA